MPDRLAVFGVVGIALLHIGAVLLAVVLVRRRGNKPAAVPTRWEEALSEADATITIPAVPEEHDGGASPWGRHDAGTTKRAGPYQPRHDEDTIGFLAELGMLAQPHWTPVIGDRRIRAALDTTQVYRLTEVDQ